MTISTPGRVPTIAFSDETDYDTFLSVLTDKWCVALVFSDGTQQVVSLKPAPNVDQIGGHVWNETDEDWNGPEFYTNIDDLALVIVL